MAFKPSQLDMIGKYESVCMEKQQDLLKRYVFFRKLDLRQDTTFHMSSRDASFHGSRYGRWQIKRKYLILREIVPVDRLADSCAFGQEHSYEWVYWIKNRDTLIQVDGRRPRVPIDTLVRISDEKYYEENIENPVITDSLRKDIKVMFKQGNVMEKSMALTVLAEVKKYFSDQEI